MTHNNPLASFYRTPKLYITLPSLYKFYNNGEVEVPETNELAVYSMTAKDEMSMKNPDALLNGEAVASLIKSCVPAVKNPRALVSNDVDALLVAIQGASYGDDIEIKSKCPKCDEPVEAKASIQASLENMTVVNESYVIETSSGLTIEIKPFSFESSVKAGIAGFKNTRSIQSIMEIEDEMERLRLFNENFTELAILNFDLLVDGVSKITGQTPDGEDFVVSNPEHIREYLENCESSVGKLIDEKIREMKDVGIQKKVLLECDKCKHQYEENIGFDPVNFFIAS
jgi:hypothetical protein